MKNSIYCVKRVYQREIVGISVKKLNIQTLNIQFFNLSLSFNISCIISIVLISLSYVNSTLVIFVVYSSHNNFSIASNFEIFLILFFVNIFLSSSNFITKGSTHKKTYFNRYLCFLIRHTNYFMIFTNMFNFFYLHRYQKLSISK